MERRDIEKQASVEEDRKKETLERYSSFRAANMMLLCVDEYSFNIH